MTISVVSAIDVQNKFKTWNHTIAGRIDEGPTPIYTCQTIDVNGFFNGISQNLIRDCYFWLRHTWKERFGRRRDINVPPKREKPVEMSLVNTRNKQLMIRMKQEVIDKICCSARSQNCKIIAQDYYCISVLDILFSMKNNALVEVEN